MPDVVYKFRPLVKSETGEELLSPYAERLLEKGELYLSCPSSFNDIFDSRIFFKPIEGASNNEIIDYYASPDMYNIYHQKSVDRNSFLMDTAGSTEAINRRKADIRDSISKASDFFRIFCFCREWDNPAMWGHYASYCKGIAVGFKTELCKNSLCISVEKNIYKENLINAVIYSNNSDLVPLINIDYKDTIPEKINFLKKNAEDIKSS